MPAAIPPTFVASTTPLASTSTSIATSTSAAGAASTTSSPYSPLYATTSTSTSTSTTIAAETNTEEGYWPIEAIVGENKSKYRVKWVGIDPSTGRAWDYSWVKKSEVTEAAKKEWVSRKRKQKKGVRRRQRKQWEEEESFTATQVSEFQPTQFLAPESSLIIRTHRRAAHRPPPTEPSSPSDIEESADESQQSIAHYIHNLPLHPHAQFEVQIPIRRNRTAPAPVPVTPIARPAPSKTPAAHAHNSRVIPDSQGAEEDLVICGSSENRTQQLRFGDISPVKFWSWRERGISTSPSPGAQSSVTIRENPVKGCNQEKEQEGKASHRSGRIAFNRSLPPSPQSPPPSYEESQRQSQRQSTQSRELQGKLGLVGTVFAQRQEVPESQPQQGNTAEKRPGVELRISREEEESESESEQVGEPIVEPRVEASQEESYQDLVSSKRIWNEISRPKSHPRKKQEESDSESDQESELASQVGNQIAELRVKLSQISDGEEDQVPSSLSQQVFVERIWNDIPRIESSELALQISDQIAESQIVINQYEPPAEVQESPTQQEQNYREENHRESQQAISEVYIKEEIQEEEVCQVLATQPVHIAAEQLAQSKPEARIKNNRPNQENPETTQSEQRTEDSVLQSGQGPQIVFDTQFSAQTASSLVHIACQQTPNLYNEPRSQTPESSPSTFTANNSPSLSQPFSDHSGLANCFELLEDIAFDYESYCGHFPSPPGDYSPYSQSFPPPPVITSYMSNIPGSGTPRLTLKEKLAKRQQELEEKLAQHTTVIATPTPPRPVSNASNIASNRATPIRQSKPSSRPASRPPSLPPQKPPQSLGFGPAQKSPPSANSIAPSPSLPSSVPQTPLPQPPPPERAETPVPEPTEVIKPALSPAPTQTVAYTQASTYLSQFGPVSTEPQEFYLGLPLNTTPPLEDAIDQKACHLYTIVKKKKEIENFHATPQDHSVAKEIFDLTYTLAQIATHPDLAFPLSTPIKDASEKQLAKRDVLMSSKFKFLKELMAVIKGEKIKIGIVAQEGPLLDMLEKFFRGIRISVKRLDMISMLPPIPQHEIDGSIMVLLLPSGRSGAVGTSCRVVIAMDSTFDPSTEEVIHIRQDPTFPNQVAPVLHLVALNTIEHIVPCLKDEQNLSAAMQAVTVLRNDAGVVDKSYEDALGDGPKRVGAWITSGCQGDPPLPPLPELPLYNYELATQTQLQTQQVQAQPSPPSLVHLTSAPTQSPQPQPVESDKYNHPILDSHTNQGLSDHQRQERQTSLKADKRKREEAINLARASMNKELSKAKKRKFEDSAPPTRPPSIPPVESAAAEVSHVSDTQQRMVPPPAEVDNGSDEAMSFPSGGDSGEGSVTSAQAPFPAQQFAFPSTIDQSQAMDLDTSPSASSSARESREPTPIQLHEVQARPIAPAPDPDDFESLSHSQLIARLRKALNQVDEWKIASNHQANLVDKYRLDNHVLTTSNAALKTELITAKSQRDRALADAERYKAENTTLKEELAALRNDMSSSSNPVIARLSTLSNSVSTLTTDLTQTRARLVSTEKDAQFAREQYQAASNANFSTRREIEEMQSEMEVLKRKADMKHVKLVEAQNDREVRELRKDNEIMKGTVAECKRGWEREKVKVGELEERIRNGGSRGVGLRGVAAGTRSGSVPRGVRGSPVGSRSGSPAAGKKR